MVCLEQQGLQPCVADSALHAGSGRHALQLAVQAFLQWLVSRLARVREHRATASSVMVGAAADALSSNVQCGAVPNGGDSVHYLVVPDFL